jgi:hypothetical protein
LPRISRNTTDGIATTWRQWVALAPVPSTIAELMPQAKGLEVARVEGEVMLVDPKDKQVLTVIAAEP